MVGEADFDASSPTFFKKTRKNENFFRKTIDNVTLAW